MDAETGNDENQVKNDTESVVAAGRVPITVHEHEKEGVPAEMAASDNKEEDSTEEAPVEEAAACGPEENRIHQLSGADSSATSEHLDVKIHEVKLQPVSLEESVVFGLNSSDDNVPPDGEDTSPTRAEEEEGEEHAQLLQELCEQRETASQRSRQLQVKLAEYFRKKAGDDGQLESETPLSEQQREYEKHVELLTELQLQLCADSHRAELQARELRLQARGQLDTVENEWRAFVALKEDSAVTLLSRPLGKQAAQAKVKSTLATEQLRQDELIKLRLKNIKLRIRIHRLQAELRDGEEHTRDPLKLQFEQLQTERLELKKHSEKQNEESLKMQKKISSSLELLSNVKEKLFWSQMEVRAKREQLAEVEATVARKRHLLTRTKQACTGLQRENLRLKECHGLLGNRVLLQDFEETVDGSDHLEEQLENLKSRQAEMVFSCGR